MKSTSDGAVLELRAVCKVYGGASPVQSLRGVTLTIRRGEMAAVVGPSGSGKSTLLHLAAGLDRPTSGQVHIAGTDLTHLGDAALSGLRARHIGVVFQQFFLLDRLTVIENVATGLLYRGIRAKERRAAATEALDRVGLAHRRHHRAADLSGGERQRVAIARALIGRPALVLADEPTGNLDTANGTQITALLQELHRQGTTLLVITHDRDVAAAMPRRIEIRDGLIVHDDATITAATTQPAAPAALGTAQAGTANPGGPH